MLSDIAIMLYCHHISRLDAQESSHGGGKSMQFTRNKVFFHSPRKVFVLASRIT